MFQAAHCMMRAVPRRPGPIDLRHIGVSIFSYDYSLSQSVSRLARQRQGHPQPSQTILLDLVLGVASRFGGAFGVVLWHLDILVINT